MGAEQQELLNYDGGTYMIYILVNAVKEQQKQLETATSNNATLQTEIDTLKQENSTMKAQLSELEALKAEVEAIKASLNINAQK
jgi:cell shape-determining protein MreC